MSNIRIILADDHVIVRHGIKALLDSEPQIQVIGEADTGRQAVDLAIELKPDLVVMDIRMPDLNGIEATRELKEKLPACRTLMLSMYNTEEYVLKSIAAGASGYVLKDSERAEFIAAITRVAEGKRYLCMEATDLLVDHYLRTSKSSGSHPTTSAALTKRELEILAHVVEGRSSREIAQILDKSARTVETHRFNLMRKLQVNNLAALISVAQEKDLLSTEE